MKRLTKVSLGGIIRLSKAVAKSLKGGEIFALVGPLGSGKTTFVQAVGKHLKIKRRIASPTFTLLNRFSVKLPGKKTAQLYHLDLYRAKNYREVKALGLEEFLGKPGTVTFIEWADKIKKHLPKKTRRINFHN